MLTEDVVLKAVAATRVAELTATAASYGPGDIASAAAPLYPELFRRLGLDPDCLAAFGDGLVELRRAH